MRLAGIVPARGASLMNTITFPISDARAAGLVTRRDGYAPDTIGASPGAVNRTMPSMRPVASEIRETRVSATIRAIPVPSEIRVIRVPSEIRVIRVPSEIPPIPNEIRVIRVWSEVRGIRVPSEIREIRVWSGIRVASEIRVIRV